MKQLSIMTTTIVATGLTLMIGASPALAGVNDAAAAVIATRLDANNPGEFGVITDGPNGFQVVNFYNQNGTPVTSSPTIESSTPNVNASINVNINAAQTYGETAAFLTGAFFDSGGLSALKGPTQHQFIIDAFPTQEDQNLQRKKCNQLKAQRVDALKAQDENFAKRDIVRKRFNKAKREGNRAEAIAATAEVGKLNTIAAFLRFQIFKLDLNIEGCEELLRITPASATIIMPASGQGLLRAQVSGGGAMPWGVFVSGQYSGLDDKRTNADRDGDIYTVSSGGELKLNDKTSVGAKFTFKDGDVTSKALLSKLDGTYYNLSVFVSHNLSQNVNLSASAGYIHGRNKVDLNGATGSFNTNAFSAAAQIQGNYRMSAFTLAPDVGVGFSHVKNNSFIASNAVVSDTVKLTYGSFSAGGTISKTFAGENSTTYTPSLGIHGIFASRSKGDLALINNTNIGQLGIGVSFAPALSIKLANGSALGFNGNISQFSKDARAWSIGGSLNIPLN